MRILQIILFYLVRMFILLVFSFIMTATIELNVYIQLLILCTIISYFLLCDNRLEYSLFEIHYSENTEKKWLLILTTIFIILFNLSLIILFVLELYYIFFAIILIECSLKIFINNNIEDCITLRKITFKGDVHETEI
ncbi:MAG: hypothetical protein ACRC5R_02250 [Mycoplasmatales bacterium]